MRRFSTSPRARSCSATRVEIARRIKRRIRELTGLTASVGVAPNKLVAKIASDLHKPDGLTVVAAARVREVLDPLSVRRLPGLGRKTGAKVEAAGIRTLGELRSAPDAVLWPLFGRYSAWMRERASGIDDRPVLPEVEEKSLSAEDTFEHDIGDAAYCCSASWRVLRTWPPRGCAHGELMAGCIGVKIRRDDFTTFTPPARRGAADLRGARHRRGGRGAAGPLAGRERAARNFACWAWSSLS